MRYDVIENLKDKEINKKIDNTIFNHRNYYTRVR